MSVRPYNPSVRVGNWNEDIQLEEDTLKDFLERRENGQLLIQRTANLSSQLTTSSTLSVARAGKVFFGSTVILLNPSPCDESRQATTLCVNPDEGSILTGNIPASCDVCAGYVSSATARNTFVITSMDGTANGEALRYGQPFYLFFPLLNMYLESDRATFKASAKKSRHCKVSLTCTPSHLSEWRVTSFDPLFRLELDNSPVDANQCVVINHIKTNQNLAVEAKYALRTLFGREFEVTANTFVDSHKAETDQNHWMITMQVPGSSVVPVAKP